MKLLIFSVLLAAACASCPNDCNGNGVCNIYSACECYRNWMGADCSQRVCYFGNAFIDTPQGDLNADGRVDRPDVYVIELKSNHIESGSLATLTAAQTAEAAKHTLKAGLFLDKGTPDNEVPSEVNSIATTVAESKGTWFEAPSTSCTTAPCVELGFDAAVITVNGADPRTLLTLGDAVLFHPIDTIEYSSSTYKALQMTVSGSVKALTYGTSETVDDYNVVITPAAYMYSTQFTNLKTWEQYPADHGVAKGNTLKQFWDEAHFYAECSGKGLCNRESGTCECFAGYTGEGCARTSCPNECSGHGVCNLVGLSSAVTYNAWDAEKTQVCECDAGYQGIDCSQRICPMGDDPITRPWDGVVAQGFKQDFYYQGLVGNAEAEALMPHPSKQQPEIQIFGHLKRINSDHPFALEFTTELGEKYVTTTFDLKTVTAADIEKALESLPNQVIQDVQVTKKYIDTMGFYGPLSFGSNCYSLGPPPNYSACAGYPAVYQITFISNTGDVPALGFRDASTSSDTFVDLNTKVETQDNGTGMTSANLMTYFGAHAMGLTASLSTTETTAFGGTLTFKYKAGYSVSGTGVELFLTEARKGTQENSECSNRGLCDYDTGLCKCFNGFTDDDCSVQNALAMY